MKTHKTDRYSKTTESTVEKEPENELVKKASLGKSRDRALARHLRKSGKLVSLSADMASVVEDFAGMSVQIQKAIDNGVKSLEKAVIGSQESLRIAHDISGNSANICNTTAETYESIQYLNQMVEDNTQEINRLIDTVNVIAKAANETQKGIDNLKKTFAKSNEAVSDIVNVGELIDVAGLNASLEAGRSGKPVDGYAIIAEKIHKTAESYEKTAVEFNELITDIQKRIDDTGIISGDINEKIRTVTVMTKGVKSAVSDILSEFTELENMAGGMSDLAGEVLSANGIPAAIGTYIETAGNIIHIFEDASDAFCNRDGIFSEVADQSNLLSSSVSRFASEQNVSSALDDIITTTDDLMNAAEQVDDDLEITVKQLSGLTDEMEELERSAEFIGEKLDTISQFTAGVIDNTENIKERLDSVQQNISESINAIEGIRKELESMVDESRSYDLQLRNISRFTGTISDYIATFKGFATILDCISLNGELEVARNRDESGFSSIPKRCETIAGELTDKLKQLKLFTTAAEQDIENIGLSAHIHYIDKTTEPVKKLQDDLSGILSREISSLNNNIEKINEIARDLDKTTGSISGNSKELISLSESTADKVKKITESAANQQSVLKKAFETCEKIQAQAEELYPEEE